MTPAEALARRARAAGLVPVGVISSYSRDSRGVLWLRGRDMAHLPDLDDPATLGCLLALVREVWKDADAYACNLDGYDGNAWVCVACGDPARFPYGVGHHHGATEAEALIVALEAAPVRR